MMNKGLLIFIFILIALVFFVIAIFVIAYLIRKRRIKKSKRLYCEIFLKKGGRDVIVKNIDDDKFRKLKGDRNFTYIIVKEAIQEEFVEKKTGTVINKFIQFDEEIANPFIMSSINGEKNKKYVGSDKMDQMLNTHIWEEVGGIGKSNIPIGWIIGAVLLCAIIIAIILLRK